MSESSNQTALKALVVDIDVGDTVYKGVQIFLIILLNSFILAVFFRLKKYTFSNLLFILLSFSDIILGCVHLPGYMVTKLAPHWPLGDALCVAYQLIANSQFTVSNQLLFLTSLHRFTQFVKPFEARERVTRNRIAILAWCWLAPYVYMTVAQVVFIALKKYDFAGCSVAWPPLYVLLHDVLVDCVPTSLTVIINLLNVYRLYKKQRDRRRLIRAEAPRTSIKPEQTVTTVDGGERSPETTTASTNRSSHQRELKATLCILAIVLNTLINEYFFLVTWPVFSFCFSCVGIDLFEWTLRIVFLFPIMNPLILIAFHRSFQRESWILVQKFNFFRLLKKST